MKGACILLLSLVCLTVCVQGNGGRQLDNFRDFIRAQRTKGSTDYVSEEATVGYLPVYVETGYGMKEADMITKLPGQPEVSFSQYSGYVTIDPNAGKALFYYFAENEDPSTKPLVLWLNGGPGCSSLGAGAMTELGPFRVNPDGKTLWHNKNAWNEVANVIFLESPAGVGFSYSNRSSDNTTGDKQTAIDAYTFLVNWLERFPEYKARDFYISGESYAGHYVPQLAALILKNNQITNQTMINLKGIAIGNAYVDVDDNGRGTNDFYLSHAIISDEIHDGIAQNCNFSAGANQSQLCGEYKGQEDEAIGNINFYDIYAPLCTSSSSSSSSSLRYKFSEAGFDPCSGDYVHAYLNSPDVQKALHANVTGIAGPWTACSASLDYSYADFYSTVIPTIKEVMASGISFWLYSGDTDSAVPFTATKYSLDKIGVTVNTPWYPWYAQGEVGGYTVGYQNITFVTVRGAGHFAPSYQPERALAMFSSFLEGKLPPGGT